MRSLKDFILPVKIRTAHLLILITVLLILLNILGCSVRKIAINSVANALSGEGSLVFSGDDDPELVGDALPFVLKLYESLYEQAPENTSLAIATGNARTVTCKQNQRAFQDAVHIYASAHDEDADEIEDLEPYVTDFDSAIQCPNNDGTELEYDDVSHQISCPNHP